jgi:single-strand DNA-binding protein
MSYLNNVTLMGNITRDPELRYTKSGTAVATFSIAISRKYTQNNEKKEETSFFECVSMGGGAEALAKWCKKGSKVALVGRLKQETWDDKDTGKQRSAVKVIADTVQFISSLREKEEAAAFTPSAPSAPTRNHPSPNAGNAAGEAVAGGARRVAETAPSPEDDDVPF